jgi:hypothetical protein
MVADVIIQECHGFSELVPTPASHVSATSAATFRNWQSFKCKGAKCEPLVRSGLHTLISPLLKDFQDRNSLNDHPIAQTLRQPQESVLPPRSSSAHRGTGRLLCAVHRNLHYSSYLLAVSRTPIPPLIRGAAEGIISLGWRHDIPVHLVGSKCCSRNAMCSTSCSALIPRQAYPHPAFVSMPNRTDSDVFCPD